MYEASAYKTSKEFLAAFGLAKKVARFYNKGKKLHLLMPKEGGNSKKINIWKQQVKGQSNSRHRLRSVGLAFRFFISFIT